MKDNYEKIIREAWDNLGDTRKIKKVVDISVKVSTNAVFKVTLEERKFLFAKISYFGTHEYFANDHIIINALSNNLDYPYERLLARSLMKDNELYIYHYKDDKIEASLVFYLPVRIKKRPPKRFTEDETISFAKSMALFHKRCDQIHRTLPKSEKDLTDDIRHLRRHISNGYQAFFGYEKLIEEHIDLFMENYEKYDFSSLNKIPVFVDWNIGNFSINKRFNLYSRWDYDWFRMGSRVLDFYFLSRVVSSQGDQTIFTYEFETLTQERFIHFLKKYHEIYPLTEQEILFIKEAYRFFILNYVIKDGRRFFDDKYGIKLQKDAFTLLLPRLDQEFEINKLFSIIQ